MSILNLDININSVKHPYSIPDPIGFNITHLDSSDPKKKLNDVCQVKLNKAKELANGQLKQIFMTLISFYFVGSSMSIFTIFFVGMYGYNSLNAILNVNKSKLNMY